MPSAKDSIDAFDNVLQLAKGRVHLGGILAKVRTLRESDEETLLRLIRERAAVVKILTKRGAPNRPFDYEYKEDFIELVEEHFGVQPAGDDGNEAKRGSA